MILNQDKIKKVYQNRFSLIEPTLRDNDIQLNYILEHIPKDKNISILDAGCGNGNYAFYLSKLGYKNISAVDLFSNIDTDKFNYLQSSIDKLPFKDKSTDFIYSNSVIYYLSNPGDGVVEFKRILKNDGLLFFTAHTKYSLFTLWRVVKRDIFKFKSMEHLEGVKFYSANYYKKLLEESVFEIILQDGYQSSFILYPFYYKMTRAFKKYFNIELPLLKPYVNGGLIGKIKSEISYHSVFVARKK
jgi:SAM-dependent methyltransferase